MRVFQLAGGNALLAAAAEAALRRRPGPAAAALAVVLGAKAALALPYARAVGAGPREWAAWAALQPAMDAAFTLGLAEGILGLLAKRDIW
jgi:hypothetical protein